MTEHDLLLMSKILSLEEIAAQEKNSTFARSREKNPNRRFLDAVRAIDNSSRLQFDSHLLHFRRPLSPM